MKRIKVLHFIHSLVSGGAEKQLRLLSQSIDKTEFDIGIFCVKSDGHDITDDRVKIFSHYCSNLLSISFIKSIYSCLRTFNPDIVHVWLPQSVSTPSMLLSRLMGKKVIFSYRNQMTFQRPLVYCEFPVALIFSNRIISNCLPKESAIAFQWLYRLKKGRVIENAVFVPDNYRRTPRTEGAPLRLIFVGRLTQQKNILRLIEALADIDNEGHQWFADIYGEGELKNEAAELIKKHQLQDRVALRGFCHQIYREMCNSDALLLPSLYEGMPNVLIESMQIGLPVIASKIPANRAIIGNDSTVIWLNPNDTISMKEAINKFISGVDDIQPLIESGKSIAARFSLNTMVNRYEDYYKELAQ